MKKALKLIILLTAAVLLLGAAGAAFADNDGSVTVSNAAIGETYSLYKVFDLTYTNLGSEDSPLFNVMYSISSDNPLYSSALEADSPFALSAADANGVSTVTLKNSSTTGEVISSWLGAHKDKLSFVSSMTPAVNSPSVVFSALKYGYYYVASSQGSLVSIDSTMKDATIIDKNIVPAVNTEVQVGADSFASSGSFAAGDSVTFRTVLTAGKGVSNRVLHIELDPAFYTKNTVFSVSAAENNYQIETVKGNGNQGCTTVITFNDNYMNSLPDSGEITVTYTARLSANSVIGSEGNKSTSYIMWSDGKKSPDSIARAFTWKIDIVSANETGTALNGAEFAIYSAQDCSDESQLKFMTESESKGETGSENGKYVLSQGGSHIVLKPGPNGAVSAGGFAAGTYYIKEVTPPAGISKIKSAAKVTISDNGTVSVNDSPASNVTFVHHVGVKLPDTGGIGEKILLVFGGIVLLGATACVLTVKRAKRRSVTF